MKYLNHQYISIEEFDIELKGLIMDISKELYDLQILTFIYFQCEKNHLYKLLVLSTNDNLQQKCYLKIGKWCTIGGKIYKSVEDNRYKLLWIK